PEVEALPREAKASAPEVEALPREAKASAPEVEPGKVVFMAVDTPMVPAAAVQHTPQAEAPVQVPPTATTVREALPAAVTEAVEAVARALVVEPSGTVVVRLSEATLAGSEVRLEVHDGKLSVAFAPATTEVRTLLQQQQEALTTQLAERFAGRWQVAVTIHESWRRKEEVRR
ncbi:MAG: type III secretion HpaP family protein, partial [Candidatus Spyradenecus sp.]